MIKYYCDVTGQEIEKNEITKQRNDFSIILENGNEVHMRAYFCVNNEGSGELSMDGIMFFLQALVEDYFNVKTR